MIIKKIKLNNIRSYINEEIKFPDGTIILSGDVGAGKSTILLAAEFCLFGIIKGELSGSSLLRKGCTEGFSSLTFSIGDREISIKRTLKKTGSGIVQDAGFITINDVTQQLTPVELKQKILEIFNYPQEALAKRSLIYRYTVYTPQEEMKAILLGDNESRLQTLRKVFSIDRYKKIKENAKIIISEAKQRKKENEGFVSDLEIKKNRSRDIENSAKILKIKIEEISKNLMVLNKKIEIKADEHKNLEEQNIKIIHLKKDMENSFSRKAMKQEHKIRLTNQLSIIEEQIKNIVIDDEPADIEKIRKKIKESEHAAEAAEENLHEISRKITEIKTKKTASEDIKNSIKKLDFCPLCRQTVAENHRHEVASSEEKKILQLNDELKMLNDEYEKLLKKSRGIKEEISSHKSAEKRHELNSIKLRDAESKRKFIENIKKDIFDIENSLDEIAKKEAEIKTSIDSIKGIEEKIIKSNDELKNLASEQRKNEIEIASSKRELETLEKQTKEINDEIKSKEKAKEKINYYIKLLHWIEFSFVNAVETMEKKVMSKVHAEFDSLMQKWFGMLMDADTIKVRLDEEFAPIIEQNGHDIEYESLSGGEKTACALAYRLALNQVINKIVSSVNTKDIIILDEPTDGFSSEQLDKIKNVIEELKMKQIIIVSHESKIESFADKIMRIEKQEHTSRVLT